MAGLTPKQEAFAQAYIETGNASEAHRRAYPNSAAWTGEALWSAASRKLKADKVATRVAQLQAERAEKHEVTVETIARQLDEDRDGARGADQFSAAIAATMGKAKLFGLITDKSTVDQTTRYVARMPDPIDEEDEWLDKHAPAGTPKGNGSKTVQ